MDNKWLHGEVILKLPELPPLLLSLSGIKPIYLTLDKNIGREVVLLITEPRSKVEDFMGRGMNTFMLKTGMVNTSFGPVYFLLFYFPDPVTGNKITYENSLNPKDIEQLSIYKELSNQKYWHVIVADDSGEVVKFSEFSNNYGLGESIQRAIDVCKDIEVIDFMRAKAEYEKEYSIEDLLEM